MNTQQCSHCHNMLKGDARFCHHCGKPVSENRGSAQGQQQQAASLNLVQFQEQREGAYSLKVPQGWKASATLQQLADASAVPTWEVSDPSGVVSMAVPGLHFSFQEPAFGYFGPPLPGRSMMRYMPAPLFIQQVTLPRLRRQNATAHVERVTEHPELIAEVARHYAAIGENPAYAKFSVASVEFVFQQQGKTYRQRTYVSVIYVPSIHCWWADVIGLVCAPIDQFGQYEPVLKTVVFSLQWNAQWLQARNARLQMLASQYMQQGLMSQQMAQAQMLQGQRIVMETGDVIRAGQARQMAAQERNFNAWDNIVAGNIDLMAPNGQVYNVTNDNQPRHWMDALGVVHGGGWNAQPNPYWTPLTPTE
jgi:hypothetical protein